MIQSSKFSAGEWVEVRSKEEILKTLDERGQLENLPFMPEMFAFCGQRLQVFKRAHKTCDPPNGLLGRRMNEAVHLEGVRCNGSAHGGCQARCLIFWKDAWLKRVDESRSESRNGIGCTEVQVIAGTRAAGEDPTSTDPVYVCQNSQVAVATHPLRWWDPRQYLEDFTSGNRRVSSMFASFLFFLYHELATAGLGLGAPLRWIYDQFQKLRGGVPYPWRIGKIPKGAKTPSEKLNLQPGELVRVKSYQQILETLDQAGHNRGMWFDAEMVPYCGRVFRVLDRVRSIINEKTGRMMVMKNECIMLEDVVCHACYAKYRRFCPRSIYAYWREIWLERVETPRTKDDLNSKKGVEHASISHGD